MKAIVYTSHTGHTRRYAELLGQQTGLPVYSMEEAEKAIPKGAPVVYLGWLFVGGIKDSRKASKKWDVRAVCGVGLCDTGTMVDQLRRSIGRGADFPVFTMQGGMDRQKLSSLYDRMIGVLIRVLSAKKCTIDEDRMLTLLTTPGDYVCQENTRDFMAWYHKNRQM